MIFGFADIWLEKVLEVLENPFCRLTAFCFLNYWHINDMNLIEEIKNYLVMKKNRAYIHKGDYQPDSLPILTVIR